MQGLAWKLAALASVVGIGFLVMLQAQRGMNQTLKNKTAAGDNAPAKAGDSLPEGDPKSLLDQDNSKTAARSSDPANPAAAPQTKAVELSDAGKSAPPAKGPAATDDPFTDGPGEQKHHPKEATRDPAVKPASAEENPFGSEPADKPAKATPAKDISALPPAAQSEPAEGKADATLSGPAAKTTPPAKAASGPSLLIPEPTEKAAPTPPAASALGAAPKGADKLTGAAPVDSTSPAPVPKPIESTKPAPTKDAGPTFGGDEPTPGQAPDKPRKSASKDNDSGLDFLSETATPPADVKSKPGRKKPATIEEGSKNLPSLDGPPKPAVKDLPGSGKSPALFPVDASSEHPLAKPLESTSPSVPPAKVASVPAIPVPSATPAAGAHGDANPDLQGDGTVGEAAPLGLQRPQLNIEKIAPQNALIGQPLIYSIIVKNVGTSEAREVVVEDRVPKGTKLSGTIPRAELTGKKLMWKIGNLASGEQRKISIRVVPLEAGEIGSVATVNFVAEAAAETVVTAPRLEFELSTKSEARLGENVPFHFRVKNVGTGEARSVVIRDLIPAGLAHSAGNDLEYEIGRLPPGKSKELTLELKAVKVGQTVNRAVVVAEGGLTTEAKASIEVTGSKVSLSRSGRSRTYLGRPAVYTNTIVNESKHSLDGVVVAESVPPGMDFASATHGGQFNEGTRTIAWRLDQVAPGEARAVKVKLVPKTPGNQTSSVRVNVPNGEPIETTSQTMVEGFASIGLDVPAMEAPVDVGEKLTFRINARNRGTIPATNVVITVDLPENLAFVSARGPGKQTQTESRLQFGPMSSLEGRTAATCEVVLEAKKRGDSRVKVSVQADQLERPLSREEPVLILSETPEPAAAP